LTDNFRSANIRLIPKKGKEPGRIKNWRPISLLNCLYKCISRAIANRLKKYMDKLCPRAQKGYSNTKYGQEVLMGVIETIENCNFLKRKGAILSLDIRKAFDSLSHSYLKCVYKFYNFGPNMIRWLTLLGTNRRACVVLNSGVKTIFFDLEQGNAQGDTLSPFLFNLGYQLLIMKLEFDLQIQGLIERVVLPETHPIPPPNPGGQEVSMIPPKVYALADDATLLVKMEQATLSRVKVLLELFEGLSGLGCNVDKTTLMQVGSNDIIDDDILGLGFDQKNEITILGMKLKNKGKCYESNMDLLIEKLRNQVRFWSRFNLSLPGRINVAKTFMYSQITYLGCILPINRNACMGISQIIEDFVNGPLRISKKRIFQKRAEGGLELIELHDFLNSQNCVWVKRAADLKLEVTFI
jgi:hypothetical protein